jgi:CheY-like chemotaxis protein
MSKKILVVDDQAEVRSLIFFSLKQLGYELIMASDGEEALDKFKKHRPGIIILDVMMPGGLSGLDVCKKIREDSNFSTRIIFLSALSQPSDIAAGFAAGGDSYITKPFSPMSLIREIHKLAKLEA